MTIFNFSEWVVRGIIGGYKTGLTPFSKVTELAANYLLKGIITQEQAILIAEECPAPMADETQEQASSIDEECAEPIVDETQELTESADEVAETEEE